MLETRPDVQGYLAHARTMMSEQRAEDCARVAREGLSHFPAAEELRVCLAEALLMQGKYAEGFSAYDARVARMKIVASPPPWPEWDGGDLSGKSIIAAGEQGIGDELMFARFIPALRARGARLISLACHTWNVRALRHVGADHTLDRFTDPIPGHDTWVLLGSLPGRLAVSMETLSGRPYLSAQPSTRGGIGLVERGNPANPVDATRSLPEGSLQAVVPHGRILEPAGDILDSLRQVAGLDLLITVDTSWAHMAGALGVPCWLLLPYRGLDWRWMRERSDSPWYKSLTLIRQQIPGDWREPLDAVKRRLRRGEDL